MQEKSTGEYRIDIATQPIPTIRAFNGKAAWAVGGGGGGRGGGPPDAPRDLAGVPDATGAPPGRLHAAARDEGALHELSSSTRPTRRSTPSRSSSSPGRVAPNVTEQLSFDRASGLLLRRLIITTGERLMNLPEQIDYSDYREVSGVKVPFTVRHATWNAVTTEKFADVKINAPIDDAVFVKPAPKP